MYQRQLFAGSIVNIQIEAIVGPCRILHRDEIPHRGEMRVPFDDVREYIFASPTNFWTRYRSTSESMEIDSVDDLEEMDSVDVPSCALGCPEREAALLANREMYCAAKKGRKCLDICAGAGVLGMGLGMGSKGIYDITHAVEIRPSAAQTIRLVT